MLLSAEVFALYNGDTTPREEKSMNVEQLRTLREANPFRPFTIHMADGRALRIPHRDYLSMSPGGRTILVYSEGEEFSFLDLLLVTELSVEAVPPAATPTEKKPS